MGAGIIVRVNHIGDHIELRDGACQRAGRTSAESTHGAGAVSGDLLKLIIDRPQNLSLWQPALRLGAQLEPITIFTQPSLNVTPTQ